MISPSNIKPLTDFLRNSKSHIEALKLSGAPELLTVNGEAAVVVQDAIAYESLVEQARQAKDDERLRLALESLRNGDNSGIPLESAMETLRAKYTAGR
jgi:hypothetical protein